jgi:ATP-dependent RNA helicase DeaD
MKHRSSLATTTDIRTFADAPAMPVSGESSPFERLPGPIREALDRRGFADLTDVQRAVLAPGLADRDLQISSQTGTGKTVALGMVLAPRLFESVAGGDAARALRAVVIVPTRELAVQVSEELRWLYASVPGLTVECVTGGSSIGQERRRLSGKPTLVVGTPGRLNDHIRAGAIECRSVAEVVLDEADRMLDMGFREELEAILDATPAERRTHLVSATFPSAMQKLARTYQNDPRGVEGTRLGAANGDIQHIGHVVRLHDRYAAIVNLLLLAKDERTLVFVDTRSQTADLADQLVADGFAAAPISGALEQFQRTRTLEAFRTGALSVLVATDVAARGLDIPDVAMVIHTDAPRDAESYVHRAGRTGRAGRKGRSVLLAAPQRRAKVEYLLGRAKVSLQWRDVPSVAAVEKSLAKRARRRLRDALAAAPAPTEKQLADAAVLLAEMEADTLVARLLELCREERTTAPRDVEVISTTASARPWLEKGGARRDRPARRTRGAEARAAHFEINWGRRDGATPQRLLAMLCRRGGVTGRMIGAIDIDGRRTTFEVADSAVPAFEQRAGMPDARDPNLVIRRARAGRG